MRERLADRLIAMAETQFAAQVPLAELVRADERFATWLRGAQLPLVQPWTEGDPPAALAALWQLMDVHDEALHEITTDVGWPGRSMVGEDGADAAWVITQHADRHHAYRRHWLPLVERAVADGEADPRHLARLTDRIALVEGGPQSYGTYAHLDAAGGTVFEVPIAGTAHDLERRRAVLGLPPLEADLAEPAEAAEAAPYRYMRISGAFAWPARRRP